MEIASTKQKLHLLDTFVHLQYGHVAWIASKEVPIAKEQDQLDHVLTLLGISEFRSAVRSSLQFNHPSIRGNGVVMIEN